MKILLYLPVVAIFLACTTAGEQTAEKNGDTSSAQKTTVPDSPCEIVDAAKLRVLLEIDATYEIEMKAKNYNYPACSFSWEDGKVVNMVDIGRTVREFAAPSEVMIVLAKETDEAMYNRSISVYKDGVAVEGIGDRATWGEKMAQLTFQTGSLLFHVHVKVDIDMAVNKEKAEKIAAFILGQV